MIITKLEIVTPAIAALWLERNSELNRKLSRERVNELSRAIKLGQWRITHQGIAFDENGTLLDGQHRLAAIVQANLPVEINVSHGLKPDTYQVMDRGWVRNLRTVCNVESVMVDACAFLARLHHVKHVQSYHIEAIASSAVGEAMRKIIESSGKRAKTRTTAPVKAMAALRWQQDAEYVETQWRALALLDYPTMSSAIQAFCRRVTDSPRSSGLELAARAWIAFDPARRAISRIQIFDQSKVIDEIRKFHQPRWDS